MRIRDRRQILGPNGLIHKSQFYPSIIDQYDLLLHLRMCDWMTIIASNENQASNQILTG